jgi:hypothetical protein
MRTSESITKLAPALLKAQKKIGSAVKGSTNPFFKSSYADLGSVMEACKDALNENGICVLQPVGNGVLETVLLHESGEFISEAMDLVSKSDNNPQDHGSVITYARRYALQSIMFIPAEDDDGNRATYGNNAPTQKTSQLVASPASDKQKEAIRKMAHAVGEWDLIKGELETLTVAEASSLIGELKVKMEVLQ